MQKTYFIFCCLCWFAVLPTQAQINTTLLGHLYYGDDQASQVSNVWGYAADGREYAIVGTYSGTSIVDVTDPAVPTELFFIEGAHGIWREPKVWSHYAYVSNETDGGLLIIDLPACPLPRTMCFGRAASGVANCTKTKVHTIFLPTTTATCT